jgi:hypothetical protein
MIRNEFNGVSNTADHLKQKRGEIEFTSTGPVVSSQNGKYGRQSAIMWGNSKGAMTRPFPSDCVCVCVCVCVCSVGFPV